MTSPIPRVENIGPFPEIENQIFPDLGYDPAQQQADAFRRRRLNIGETGRVLNDLRRDPDFLSAEVDFYERSATADKGTFQGAPYYESHRQLTPTLATVLTEPRARREFLKALDTDAAVESEALKAEAKTGSGLNFDVVIWGGGMHTAVLSARMRHEYPGIRIGIIDENGRLGGQFRSYGDRPVFYGNSRNHRRQDNDINRLPGGEGNLNSLGIKSPLQLPDFTSATNFTNKDLGDTAAIVNYLSAESMLDTEVVLGERITDTDGNPILYRTTVVDKSTGESFPITSFLAVDATGAGKRRPLRGSYDNENVLTVEELLATFGNEDNKFPMDKFVNKTVSMVGSGDSGKIGWELLTWLAPPEAYGRSTVQYGGPSRGLWFGCNFTNRQEYCDAVRPRYEQLANFIVRMTGQTDGALIIPSQLRLDGVFNNAEGNLDLDVSSRTDNSYATAKSDVVINAQPLDQNLTSRFGFDVSRKPLTGTIGTSGESVVIGSYDERSGTFFAGPAARSPLGPAERALFDDKIGENTVSLWATSPRTESLAIGLAESIRRIRRGR